MIATLGEVVVLVLGATLMMNIFCATSQIFCNHLIEYAIAS